MIHEVDEALRGLLREEALDGSDVEVVFDAPTKDWAARRNAPTINLYLYDIREDLRKRSRGLINEYDRRARVTGRRLPPRYYKLSYLLSAWTQRPEDEHRLLSLLLDALLRHDALPVERLTGRVHDLGLPVDLQVGLPPPEDRSFADVWTALGGELKPSLDVVLSVPIVPARVFEAGPPVTDGPYVAVNDTTSPLADPPRRKHVLAALATVPAQETEPDASETRHKRAPRRRRKSS